MTAATTLALAAGTHPAATGAGHTVLARGDTWSVLHGAWFVGIIGVILLLVGLGTLVTRPGQRPGAPDDPASNRWRRRLAGLALVAGALMLVGALLS